MVQALALEAPAVVVADGARAAEIARQTRIHRPIGPGVLPIDRAADKGVAHHVVLQKDVIGPRGLAVGHRPLPQRRSVHAHHRAAVGDNHHAVGQLQLVGNVLRRHVPSARRDDEGHALFAQRVHRRPRSRGNLAAAGQNRPVHIRTDQPYAHGSSFVNGFTLPPCFIRESYFSFHHSGGGAAKVWPR